MNRHGSAARFAYNPEAVLAYLDELGRPEGWNDAIHGRTVRRWRTQHGITRGSFAHLVSCYTGVGEREYVAWSEKHGYAPILRNHNKRSDA